jgi:arylsulfatase
MARHPVSPAHTSRFAALGIVCAVVALGVGCGRDEPPPRSNRLNLLVFLLDTARADHFGCYGYERDTTPNIDALAREGVVYETVVAEAASTFASTVAFMTGSSPAESGLLQTTEIPLGLKTLGQRAAAAGYRTYGYSENPFITSKFGFDRGFEEFVEVFPHALFAELGSPDSLEFESDKNIAAALDWIEQPSPKPFFAYFHILRPHNPYRPTREIAGMFAGAPVPHELIETPMLLAIDRHEREISPEEMELIVAAYDENLRYADELFGIVLERLRESGRLDETIVVVLSDHGEAFLEHGRMLHTSTVYEEMIRVPAVVRHPGFAGGGRIAPPLQLRQIGRAIAQWLDAPNGSAADPADPFGVGTASSVTHSWTLPRFGSAASRSATHKLIINVGAAGCFHSPRELYDLTRDPDEQQPLDPVGRPEAEQLEAAFRAHTPEDCEALGGNPEVDFDEVMTERLRALGYID